MISRFQKHWQLLVAIDVGGDSAPACGDSWLLPTSRAILIVTAGFHNRTSRISDVAHWIKRNLPYNETRTRFIIDPENPPVTVELSDHGIYASPAQKSIMPGQFLLRLVLATCTFRSTATYRIGTPRPSPSIARSNFAAKAPRKCS